MEEGPARGGQVTPAPVMEPDLPGKRVAFFDKNGATRLAVVHSIRRRDIQGRTADGRRLKIPKGEVQHVQTPTKTRAITWLNDGERRRWRWPQGKKVRAATLKARRGA